MIARILIAFLATASVAAGQCPGDNDLDGTVTISELVAAVNSALSGCVLPLSPTPSRTPTLPQTATPTRRPSSTPTAVPCPFDFHDEVFDESTCAYTTRSVGDPHINCRGPFTITWISTGSEAQFRVFDSVQRRDVVFTGGVLLATVVPLFSQQAVVNILGDRDRIELFPVEEISPAPKVGSCTISSFTATYIGLTPYRVMPPAPG